MLRIDRFTHVGRIDRVDVYVHWTVLVVVVVMLLGVVRQPLPTLVGLGCWLGVMLLHECGHMMAAKRRHSQVYAIELYPIFALTKFETPWSRFDHALIAWGGVLAQAVVAIPIVLWIKFFGYTPFELVNEALVICGLVSLAIAAFNLLPFKPLDGSMAWQIFPAALERARNRKKQSSSGWRSYR
jgi:membrane-associated protease RseP (regulator of RpoE activity)